MIVLDASVVVEMLRGGTIAEALWEELLQNGEPLIVPHLLDIEVTSALRRIASDTRMDAHRAQQFIDALELLPASRYEHTPLLRRIWGLRRNFTSYDAAYIALAEATRAVLYTCDRKLAVGHRAQVRIVA
jgi:predicted nucleic acid-binding protein